MCLPGRENTMGVFSPALELEGPDGERAQPTSNRAELRAVIHALEHRYLSREGWEALVIATDSTYVVNGATSWVPTWVTKEWCKADGTKAANIDLWKHVFHLFRLYAIHGCEVLLWHIPRKQNALADKFAKEATTRVPLTSWNSYRHPFLKQEKYFDF
ncbi:Uu.00g027830.m01.CDS01 [Anthostomella pinea]|uniref:ribonuclease H n=1 Tax=Anthostomella pinea TaxID=933095 RepID=A0AAI8V8T7_9PEZI|nr:Uu.00g027830.m01.CDS01 [Anthostomella pinea]